jgi:hypothetical protein
MGNTTVGFVRERLKGSYSETGRPSVDPELLLRILLIGYLTFSTPTPVHNTYPVFGRENQRATKLARVRRIGPEKKSATFESYGYVVGLRLRLFSTDICIAWRYMFCSNSGQVA